MPSFPRLSINSAHALAFVALVTALGGGYAVAQGGSAPEETVVYQGTWPKGHKADSGATLIGQVVVPADGALAASAKLTVRKRAGHSYGRVTCFLGAVGRRDEAFVTLGPGEASTLALQSVGSPASPVSGSTQAIDLFCESDDSPYVVSDARVTAISLDDVRRLKP